MSKYFIDCDDDGHAYIIPLDRRKEWFDWLVTQENSLPEFCDPIDGPTNIIVLVNMDDIINTVVSNYESTYIMSNKANKSQEKIQIDQKLLNLLSIV